MINKKKIIILGSGPTGLITAWRLLERGFDVEIIEKILPQVDYVDLGNIKILSLIQGHIFFIQDKELKKLEKKF